MQSILCGTSESDNGGNKSSTSRDNSNGGGSRGDEFNPESLRLSSSQSQNLKVLFRLFSSNPKILYAPVNTTADKIIAKANSIFALIDSFSQYARQILNISLSLEEYLALNTTRKNFLDLQQIHLALLPDRDYIEGLGVEPLSEFVSRDPLPDSDEMQGVIFEMNDDGSLPNHMVYKIRQNAGFTTKRR